MCLGFLKPSLVGMRSFIGNPYLGGRIWSAQRKELGERPGLLVADKAGELELVARPVHEPHLVLAVVGVEREGLGDRALRVFRRELVGVEEPGLRAVVPARHREEKALHAFVVGQRAARKERERPERQPLRQEQAPLDRADELRGVLGETRIHRAFLHEVLLARPVMMVGKVRGTRITITMCTSAMNTIKAMAKKCTRRAPS